MPVRMLLLTLLLTLVGGAPTPAVALDLFATDGSQTLYRLDETTGAATAIASNYFLNELAFHPDGTLYAIASPPGGAQRIVTLDPSTGQATDVTSSVQALGSGQGIVDMTFDLAGNLFLAHHRHAGSGSGVGVYAASLVDGIASSFVTSGSGGFAIGTVDNGNLLHWTYFTQAETSFAGVAQAGFPNLRNAAGQLCSVPTGPSGNTFQPMAVEAGSGLAWGFDSPTCGLIRVDIATGQTTGIGDPSGLGFLTGIAAMPAAPDADDDGVPDESDNCPSTPNGPDQGTCIGSPAGPACLSDADCGGGVCSLDQEDGEGDGVGDVCDNCADAANPGQADDDLDDFGDVCDCDFSGDGVCDIADFNLFLVDFIVGTPTPGLGIDMDGDGSVAIGDFNLFLQGFILGVPGPSAFAP